MLAKQIIYQNQSYVEAVGRCPRRLHVKGNTDCWERESVSFEKPRGDFPIWPLLGAPPLSLPQLPRGTLSGWVQVAEPELCHQVSSSRAEASEPSMGAPGHWVGT